MPVNTDDLRNAIPSLYPDNLTGQIDAARMREGQRFVADVIDEAIGKTYSDEAQASAATATTQAGIAIAQAAVSTGAAADALASATAAALYDGPRFGTIALMQAGTGFADGKFVRVDQAANGEQEGFVYNAASTLTADGALIVDATGMGVGRLISTRTVYADFATLDADLRVLAAGTILTVQGIGQYVTVSSGADFTTTGGLPVQVVPRAGHITLEMLDKTGGTDFLPAWNVAKLIATRLGGATMHFGVGTYNFSAQVTHDNVYLGVVGHGSATRLVINNGGFRVSAKDAGVNLSGLRIEHFDVERTGTAYEDKTSAAVDSGTNIITLAGHGWPTAHEVVPQASVNGLTAGTPYFVIRITANTFKMATTVANAYAGTAFDLTGTTNLTFRDFEFGAFEIFGDDITSPQRAFIRGVIGDIRVQGSTGSSFVMRAGGYQYTFGPLHSIECARRPLYIAVGDGANTALNAVPFSLLELRSGAQGLSGGGVPGDPKIQISRDSLIRGVRNLNIQLLLVQGGPGLVIGADCQTINIGTFYSELAKSPEHGVDLIIGESGAPTPQAITIGNYRCIDSNDSNGDGGVVLSGKSFAIKLVRVYNCEIGDGVFDGYDTGVINNAYVTQNLVTGRFGNIAGAGQIVDRANYYFRPRGMDHYCITTTWAGATVTAGTTSSAVFTLADARIGVNDGADVYVSAPVAGLTFNPRLAAGVFNVDVTAHNAGNVTIGSRTVRAKITPQAMIQAGVDIAWPVV